MQNAQRTVGLVEKWRAAATTLRGYGAEPQAVTLEHCAAELEEAAEEWAAQPLTLSEAATLSGYSEDHLGRLVRENKVPNAGRPGAPRIAREHLPIKAGVARDKPRVQLDYKQIVRSAIIGGV